MDKSFFMFAGIGGNSLLIAAIAAVLLLLVLILELGLRATVGFGNPSIYIPDEQIGYLLAPNQQTQRFGNRIDINSYSMRSAPIDPTPSASTSRVLMLGDSIVNGGWWTDQTDTLSALLSRQLQARLNRAKSEPVAGADDSKGADNDKSANDEAAIRPSLQQVEVLNASANSWGPRNELAYLEKFGHFDAQTIVLVINTDDLFAAAPSMAKVGRGNYPDRKPPFALAEVFNRYLLPVLPWSKTANLPAPEKEPGDPVDRNLAAIQRMAQIAHQADAQFLLAMTPLLRELGDPGPRDYERQARQKLTQFAQAKAITYIDFLPLFNRAESFKDLYRDHIHLSPQGNQQVSQTICSAISR